MIKQDFGKYFIEKELGKGGMATVYLATHKDLGRKVAVKIMHPHLAADPESRIRFEREAKAIARLEHTNILQIYDFGSHENCFYIAMELIDGTDGEKLVKLNGPFPPEIAAVLFCGVAGGLHQAHVNHIIHRDIKLSNIIVKQDGVAKLSDFGIVKTDDAASLTNVDSVVGTPYYLSPELVSGDPPSIQSDIYALGVSLYYAITGHYPYPKNSIPALFSQIVAGTFIPVRERGVPVPENLVLIIEKCLERKIENRYSDASLLARDLNSFLSKNDIPNDSSEVVRYLSGPQKYSEELMQRNLKSRLERAATFKAKGLIFDALREYEALLEMAPDNEEVKQHIAALGALHTSSEKTDVNLETMIMPVRFRRGRWLVGGALVVLLLFFGTLLFLLIKPSYQTSPEKAGSPEPLNPVMGEMKAGIDTVVAKKMDTRPSPMISPIVKVESIPGIQKSITPPDLVPQSDTSVLSGVTDTCFGYLFVFSEIWGDIYLNGVKSGKAPMKEKLRVACGAYEMTIENPSGKRWRDTVRVAGGVTRRQIKAVEFQ